jgi:hypothetical protein
VSFAAITLCAASQRVFIFVVVYFVIDSVRKLLDTPSYTEKRNVFKVMSYLCKGPHLWQAPSGPGCDIHVDSRVHTQYQFHHSHRRLPSQASEPCLECNGEVTLG